MARAGCRQQAAWPETQPAWPGRLAAPETLDPAYNRPYTLFLYIIKAGRQGSCAVPSLQPRSGEALLPIPRALDPRPVLKKSRAHLSFQSPATICAALLGWRVPLASTKGEASHPATTAGRGGRGGGREVKEGRGSPPRRHCHLNDVSLNCLSLADSCAGGGSCCHACSPFLPSLPADALQPPSPSAQSTSPSCHS